MDLDNDLDFEMDLNLDFDSYARHFVANDERYTENGFFFYQIQTGLEGSPTASEVFEDLELMADEGLLEREEIGSSSKMPDTQYFLSTTENRTEVEAYAEATREWNDAYADSIRDVIPPSF